jgi:DNA polymerase
MNGAVFGVPYEEMSKKHKLYMLCKVLELALGYQGGVGAFMSMAKVYGLNVQQLAEELHEHDLIPERLLHQANRLYHNPKFRKAVQSTGLDQFTWCYLDAVKRAWRERRPATTTFWRKVDECVRNALDNPGIEFTCGNKGMLSIEYDLESNFLGIRLPSGRIITYYKPKISGRKSAHDGEEGEDADEYETVVIDGVEHAVLVDKPKPNDDDTIISYLTLTEKGWTKVYSHGGKFTNNIVQGIARDLMAHATVQLEKDEWNVVLHIHDQALCELDITDPRTAKDLEEAMCELPEWADGLIIEAEGEELMRFAK